MKQKYFMYKVITFIFVNNICYAQYFSDKLYIKFELPIHQSSYKKDSNISINANTRRRIGVGYSISPNVDIEFIYNNLHFSYIRHNNISTFNPLFNNILKDYPYFAITKDGVPSKIKGSFLTKDEICYKNIIHNDQILSPVKHNAASKIKRSFFTKDLICYLHTNQNTTKPTFSITAKSLALHTLIPSVKYNFTELSDIFTPYVSAGVGLVFGKYTQSEFSTDSPTITTKTQRTTKIGAELGMGTTVKITDNVLLDLNAKYYEYGRHHYVKRINGCQFSIGMVFKF